jgi:NAD(P)-dependent dehydrogenase (short-subunit alcohol dehydrogenase family)
MADHRQVDAATQAIDKQFGPIATWVNNAMTGTFAEFTSTDPADFERAVAVNFLGSANGTRVLGWPAANGGLFGAETIEQCGKLGQEFVGEETDGAHFRYL